MTVLAFFVGLLSGFMIGSLGLHLYWLRQDEKAERRRREHNTVMAIRVSKACQRSLAVKAARARLGHDTLGHDTPGGRFFEDLFNDDDDEPWRG